MFNTNLCPVVARSDPTLFHYKGEKNNVAEKKEKLKITV